MGIQALQIRFGPVIVIFFRVYISLSNILGNSIAPINIRYYPVTIKYIFNLLLFDIYQCVYYIGIS